MKKELEDSAKKVLALSQETEEAKQNANGERSVDADGLGVVAGIKRSNEFWLFLLEMRCFSVLLCLVIGYCR